MDESLIREHLVKLLGGTDAHLDFDDIISHFPVELRTVKPHGAAHSAWQLLEHLRIAQWDILEFSRNPNHISPAFPDGYWPKNDTASDDEAWGKSLRAFRSDREALQDLVANQSTDLLASIPHGTGQTIFRECFVVAKHNSYHLGQLVLLRRLLGIWKEDGNRKIEI
ncbi:MAG: DinB family protein [candidate division Zixibacteria bacterium]|nr:DinB family protein [candidate division Zixibacteria bacterium]